jgi:hypothetical protein
MKPIAAEHPVDRIIGAFTSTTPETTERSPLLQMPNTDPGRAWFLDYARARGVPAHLTDG